MKIKHLSPFILAIIMMACGNQKTSKKTTIVCTTGMIGDLVSQISPESFEVITLMGPGVDPHLYKATSKDISNLKSADLIFFNGLHLEGKMQEVLDKMPQKAFAVTDSIPDSLLIPSSDYENAHDPHVWFDLQLWMKCLDFVSSTVSKAYPDQSEIISKKTQTYRNQLISTEMKVKAYIDSIPKAKRILVTAHDAFGYFGKAYGIQVEALQGISTVSEFGLQDVMNLSQFLKDKEIKAIFVESSVSSKSIEKVIETTRELGHEVTIGGSLFSDAMGAKETPEGNYIGMFLHNAKTISENLK